MPPDPILLDRYHFVRHLSADRSIYWDTQRNIEVVVKVFLTAEKRPFFDEVEIHERLHGKGPFPELTPVPIGELVLVLEFIPGSSLDDELLFPKTLSEAKQLTHELLELVVALQRSRIIHGTLSPKYILRRDQIGHEDHGKLHLVHFESACEGEIPSDDRFWNTDLVSVGKLVQSVWSNQDLADPDAALFESFLQGLVVSDHAQRAFHNAQGALNAFLVLGQPDDEESATVAHEWETPPPAPRGLPTWLVGACTALLLGALSLGVVVAMGRTQRTSTAQAPIEPPQSSAQGLIGYSEASPAPPVASSETAAPPSGSTRTIPVRVTVEPDGSHQEQLLESSGDPKTDAAILRDLQSWKWRPGEKDGVAVEQTKTIDYALSR